MIFDIDGCRLLNWIAEGKEKWMILPSIKKPRRRRQAERKLIIITIHQCHQIIRELERRG